MKKRILSMLLLFSMITFLHGCSFSEVSKDKVRDLEYTVVPEEEIPEELKTIIAEKKEQVFELSFAAGNDLYIVIGYGKQNTGGYSITVEELYATDSKIVVSTNLMGPGKDEKIEETPSYPYIVLKTEYLDLSVEYAGIENELFQ